MPGWSACKEIVVRSLDEYVRTVAAIRSDWLDDPLNELWFRGEDEKHNETTLWPELFRSSKPLADVLKVENSLFEEFKRCGIQYSDFDPEDDWNWYYIVQHHGGPTRLLDWSDGSLMAAHFATRSKSKMEDLSQGSVVYVLDPHWLVEHLDNHPDAKKHRRAGRREQRTEIFPRTSRMVNMRTPGCRAVTRTSKMTHCQPIFFYWIPSR
jgi:FRG domain